MWRGTGTSADESSELDDLFGKFPGEEVFSDAQPLTVQLRGMMVREDEDWGPRGDNDLMIVTKFQFGDEPMVDRLHYIGREDALGWHGDFFHDDVLSIRDLTEEQLTLRIQVYDLDGVDAGLVDSVTDLSTQAAIVFPQIAPYAGLVGLGVGSLLDLVNNVDNHDLILDDRVTLEIAQSGTRQKPLQPGYFVCFKHEVDDGLVLGDDLRVSTASGDEYLDGSYAILQVSREHLSLRERELDQKVAKLVAELNGKGQNEKAALHFLRDTLGVYTKFRRLERATELLSKESLTDDEKRLLEELETDPDIRDYLGDD